MKKGKLRRYELDHDARTEDDAFHSEHIDMYDEAEWEAWKAGKLEEYLRERDSLYPDEWKIIFLDIDGVLVTQRHMLTFMPDNWNELTPEQRTPYRRACYHGYDAYFAAKERGEKAPTPYHRFDPVCVEQLNRILLSVDPYIVISSAWRILHGPRMEDILREQGVRLKEDRYLGETGDEHGGRRGLQIQAWLDEQGLGTKGIAILDDETFDMEHLTHLVFESTFEEGLTETIADQVIAHFNVYSF